MSVLSFIAGTAAAAGVTQVFDFGALLEVTEP
jgi:hypothetical protein